MIKATLAEESLDSVETSPYSNYNERVELTTRIFKSRQEIRETLDSISNSLTITQQKLLYCLILNKTPQDDGETVQSIAAFQLASKW